MMTSRRFFQEMLARIQEKYSPGEATTIAYMLFEFYTGLTRTDLIRNPFIMPETGKEIQLEKSVKLLLEGMPVQYILREAWFYNLKLRVSPAVLIPRPETEELVEKVLLFCGDQNKKVLDIGTGSGCIPVALYKNAPALKITAADISGEALAVAKENALMHQCDVSFLQLDFLREEDLAILGSFDVIVSNPPYIPLSEASTLESHVKDHEPNQALFVEEPLIFYRSIAAFGRAHLEINGRIFMEVHRDYARAVADHFASEGYEAKVHKDMQGNERIVEANRSR